MGLEVRSTVDVTLIISQIESLKESFQAQGDCRAAGKPGSGRPRSSACIPIIASDTASYRLASSRIPRPAGELG